VDEEDAIGVGLAAAGGHKAEQRRRVRGDMQRACDQFARAIERMAFRLDADRIRHQPASRPFVARAFGAIGQTIARPARQTCNDGGLGEPLQIDHRIVGFAAQSAHESAQLGRRAMAEPAGSGPAPQGQLDHVGDAAHPSHQRRERRLDDPVDHCFGMGGTNVGDDGQRMHDVAERRELDDQDAHAAKTVGASAPDALNAPPSRLARRA
jgi:hypothetical protein